MSYALYRAATHLATPLAGPWLARRAAVGKEDPARLQERWGRSAVDRPAGPLVWLHGASVGETALALDLLERLRAQAPDWNALLTSGTVTSAALAARRLPARSWHHYAPLDAPRAVRAFLDHWRPDLGLLLESELWPNLLLGAAERGIPLALLNARLSARSLAGWARAPRLASAMFGAFQFIHAADTATAEGLAHLGVRTRSACVNLKLAASPLPPDPTALSALQGAIGGRPCWLAASTHPGEDAAMLEAHALVRQTWADALLILAPRHPERGADLAAQAGGAPRRSLGQAPNGPVFIVDTIGELGLWHRLAPLAFVGASLAPDGRGHNPCEAIAAGCTVASGRGVSSFRDVYAALDAAGAVAWVASAAEIAEAVSTAWREPDQRQRRVAAGQAVLTQARGEAEAVIHAVLTLPKDRVASHAAA